MNQLFVIHGQPYFSPRGMAEAIERPLATVFFWLNKGETGTGIPLPGIVRHGVHWFIPKTTVDALREMSAATLDGKHHLRGVAPPQKISDNATITRAAKLFYERALTRQEIGKQLDLDPRTVTRLLKEARLRGIVKISIVKPESNTPEPVRRTGRGYAASVPGLLNPSG